MITQDYLRRILHYDEETGLFKWREKISIKTVIGKTAGGFNAAGYRVIGIAGKLHYAHRLAWVYMTGEWPTQVDHSDGNRANNSWTNLRIATHQQNVLNSKRFATNTSGYKGVCWHKAAGKWAAAIFINGKPEHLGLFECPQKAHEAYLSAAKKYQPEFARAS